MLENYNFRDGKTLFNYFYRLKKDISNIEENEKYLSEDLLSVSYFEEKYIIDIGCYTKDGGNVFIARLINNNDWDNPVLEKETKILSETEQILDQLINWIYR